MSSNPSYPNTPYGQLAAGLDKVHDSWGWFIALGVALIALGIVCIMGNVTATKVTVVALGWLLALGAVVSLVEAFRSRDWSGFFLFFLSALLRGVAGYMLIRYPNSGEVSITILLASLLIVGGIFRIVGANTLRFPSWGWAVVSGVVALILGFMLIFQLPTASTWFIGLLVGIDFIIDGASSIAFGNAVHHIPAGRDFVRTA